MRWFKDVKSGSYPSIIYFTTVLIFETVDWFLLVFLIFWRGLRSIIYIFWTFVQSIKTLSFSSFIASSSGWDYESMFNASGIRPFWTLLLICPGFTWVWREGVFCDSISPFGCIKWCWSEWEFLLLASTFGNRFRHFDCNFNFISSISISERYLFFIIVRYIVASLLGSISGRAVGFSSLQIS